MIGNINSLKLTGAVKSFEYAYTSKRHDEQFYQIVLEVPRLSDSIDTILIYTSEKLVFDLDLKADDIVTVTGQIRTRNYTDEEGHNHLEVYGYATDISILENPELDPKETNQVSIEGYICCLPRIRKTNKSKRVITDLMLAVNRSYSRSDYVPCIVWGRDAIVASKRQVGDKVAVQGRFQSRQYYKKNSDIPYTSYEISVTDIQVISLKDDTTESEDNDREE